MKKLLLSILFILLTSNLYGADLSKSHTWVDGEIPTASLWNGNEDPLYSTINDLEGANLKSDIAITTSGTCNFTGTFQLGSVTLLPTGTELNYVDGVTSAIQTQFTNKQALDDELTDVAGLTTTDNGVIIGNGSSFVVEEGATLKTSLGLTIGTNVQAYDAQLADVAGLTTTDNGVIIGNGANFVVEEGATLKTSLGLTIGTNVQAYDAQLADLADGTLSGAGTCDTSALTGTTYLPDGTVDTSALKTATAEVTNTNGSQYLTLTGGEYCFFPKQKMSGVDDHSYTAYLMGPTANGFTTYATCIWVSCTAGGTQYFTTRYVTASGEDFWLFILIDKSTKDILSMSAAPDHPAYGNSNDFEKQPSPFMSFNPETQEIILIEKNQAKAIQQEAKDRNSSVLELIEKDYKIDFSQTYPYVPTHSGQFSPEHTPVLVMTVPEYIQIRKLISLTDDDKLAKEDRKNEKQAEYNMKKLDEEFKKNAILKKLGITKEEAELLK